MHPGCPAEISSGQLVLGELCPRHACPQPCLSSLCDFMPKAGTLSPWFQACLRVCLLLLLTGLHELDFRSALFILPSLELMLDHFQQLALVRTCGTQPLLGSWAHGQTSLREQLHFYCLCQQGKSQYQINPEEMFSPSFWLNFNFIWSFALLLSK